MDRRLLLTAAAALPLAARAHHGWSSFDVARPIYLEGKAVNVAWRNPHAELDLDVAADLKLPADLAQRALPAQAATVDGPGLLKAAQLPTRKDKRWHIELSPLSRLEAWKAAEIKNGDVISMLGFTFAGEKGDAILRVEYLWAGGKTYALRSSPA
jgi:Family of unknown function (DUF6152)